MFRTYVSGLRRIAEDLRLDLVSVVASRNLGCSCWTRKLQALKELLVEWQGLKVKRESSAMFVQERIISYHIPLYHVVLYYVLYGGVFLLAVVSGCRAWPFWPGSMRPKAQS